MNQLEEIRKVVDKEPLWERLTKEELKEVLREGKAPLKVGATKKENLKVVGLKS